MKLCHLSRSNKLQSGENEVCFRLLFRFLSSLFSSTVHDAVPPLLDYGAAVPPQLGVAPVEQDGQEEEHDEVLADHGEGDQKWRGLENDYESSRCHM